MPGRQVITSEEKIEKLQHHIEVTLHSMLETPRHYASTALELEAQLQVLLGILIFVRRMEMSPLMRCAYVQDAWGSISAAREVDWGNLESAVPHLKVAVLQSLENAGLLGNKRG
jgi:hypothetical protein